MREYVEPLYGWDAHIQRRYHAGWFKPDRLSIIEDDDGREVGVLDVRDEGDHLYLSRIEILPEGQGRGLGTAVVTAVLGRGRMVRLDIFPHNVRARRFYERLGFALDREQRREGRLSMHHLGHGNDRARAEEMGSQAAVRLGGMNAPAPRRPRPPEANTVVAYDASWPDRFDAIRRHLLPVFIATGATIEHVGSTSVPSLAAKPIIDINVVVQDAADVPDAIERLASLGYVHEGDLGVQGREALSQSIEPSGLAYHHLYVVVEGTPAHFDHVGFRDYLRDHPEEAARYQARKFEVAHLITPESRDAYIAAKAGLVEELLTRARAERPS